MATGLPCPWDSPGKNTGVGCHFLLQCMKVKNESEVAQSCLTLSDPMDCSLPGSSIHGIFQARVLEWGAIAFSDKLVYIIVIHHRPQPSVKKLIKGTLAVSSRISWKMHFSRYLWDIINKNLIKKGFSNQDSLIVLKTALWHDTLHWMRKLVEVIMVFVRNIYPKT